MLLETLLKQEEGQEADEGTWNLSMAGGTCLGLVANTVGDECIQHVLPFVEGNAMVESWRNREAALLAFGSILDGPKPETLEPLINQSLGKPP
jgi:importin subunit beta-1